MRKGFGYPDYLALRLVLWEISDYIIQCQRRRREATVR